MRQLLALVLLLSTYSSIATTRKDTIGTTTAKKEKALAVVPIITSSPLMGFGVGLSTSYLYSADSSSSKSQLRIGGQYSSTKSYNIFGYNNMWFNNNKTRLTTAVLHSGINNQFTENDLEVEYNINTFAITQLQMFEVADHLYIGGPLMYKQISYSPNNEEGAEFLKENGIEDERAGGLGVAASYDTRRNKYYPSNSVFLNARIDYFPDFLGSDRSYNKLVLDARGYIEGFKEDDVLAMQFYGAYASYFAPDAGLPAVSGKAMLRGFPNGQLKARYMTGVQAEYRYTIPNSRFRVTGFTGVVNLAGGSYGNGTDSREDDGWYNAVGVGARYKLQQVTGVDLRLDLVRTSLQEGSVYLTLNQAF